MLRAYVGQEADIVAVVPRGVGATLPSVTCDVSDTLATQRQWAIQNILPGYDEYAVSLNYALGQSIGLDCNSTSPDLIPYVGTEFSARDMDVVLRALGQEQMDYLGFSYGTVLGQTYAVLFPDRVDRMVLDGVLNFDDYYAADKDPRADIGDADLALNNSFQACFDAGRMHCALWSNSIDEIKERFEDADQRIHDMPLPVLGYGLLTWSLWRSGVYNALYKHNEGFPLLAGGVLEILAGEAGPYLGAYLQIVQSAVTSSLEWPTDPDSGLKNSPNNGYFISCSDSGGLSTELSTEQLLDRYSRYQEVSSYFAGVSYQYAELCWSARLRSNMRRPGALARVDTANPVLFVGNTADPTTPIRNALRMSTVFSGSRVLTISGTGHLSFNAANDTACASKWIVPYFSTGALPPNGTVCQGMQEPFAV